MAGQLDGGLQDVLPAAEVCLSGVELLLGRSLLGSQAILLALQQLERDGVRVEGLEQLLTFVGDLGELLGERRSARRSLGLPFNDLRFQLRGEEFDLGGGKVFASWKAQGEGIGDP